MNGYGAAPIRRCVIIKSLIDAPVVMIVFQPATGALMSEYVLEVFAHHLKSIEGAVYNEDDPAIGALALTLAALHRAVHAWETGRFIKPPEFSKDNVGKLTDGYLKRSVQPLVEKKRYKRLVRAASEYAHESVKPQRRSSTNINDEFDGALIACDPSSPITPLSDNE
ncbi:hypothetical protein FA95DRAFT_1611624 [Auriscalpium vulgare]|uniref:Uncharacterized protein n=1 Tax=Auriscalpium vulgare TaxID=40419 RepID=A0ACB8R9G7_9AGAM|nr:hypothetical protein FA95DRAFT_1611624 [Auriscalpium vulgare]